MAEKDIVFRKTYKCPICDSSFKSLTVKQGKARPDNTEYDLKVNYKGIEPLKYDVILCTVCGYASLERYYERVSALQRHNIIEKISQGFSTVFEDKDEYSFDDAIVRYKFALMTSTVKQAKNSEMGLLYLKLGWLFRSYARSLDSSNVKKKDELYKLESSSLQSAYKNFEIARAKEHSPICGMDEVTFDTLLAGLSVKLRKNDEARNYINAILSSRSATSRAKERARDLKEMIMDSEE